MRVFLAASLLMASVSAYAADRGRETFVKFRCDTCHSVYGETVKKQVPLPDLSKYSERAVTAMIVSRTELDPHALFDEMAMSVCASQVTKSELADIVKYLRMGSELSFCDFLHSVERVVSRE